MVDNEYSTEDYKTSKICIEAITKNPEMLRLVPDRLKTKMMYKQTVKKLSFVIRCIPVRYKIQQMCDNAVLENHRTLKSILDCYNCYKYQKMCNQPVDNNYQQVVTHFLIFVICIRICS